MERYKRNQVEEAISRISGEKSARPSLTLRVQLKRLLDTDRNSTHKARASGAETVNYAFYSSDSPGKGSEVYFSSYEAFALETGLRLLDHGWPQGFVVNVLRHIRRSFERQHSHILKQDPTKLFDPKLIAASAEAGLIGADNTDPVFLTLVTGKHSYKDGIDDRTSAKICRGMKEVSHFVKEHQARSWSLFELATRAHRLKDQLALARPRTRGRHS
jgi:hypothetical protein